jgi:hypothetical protein
MRCGLTGKDGTVVLPRPMPNLRRVLWDGQTEPVLQWLLLLARPKSPRNKPLKPVGKLYAVANRP